jgi:hypothetical protein
MPHLRLHLVYLAVIGFLTYQYWAKTQALNNATQSIEQLDKLLTMNNVVIDRTTTQLFYDIEINVKAYPNTTNMVFLAKAKNVMSSAEGLNTWLENQKATLINMSGGLSNTDTTVLDKRLSTKPNRTFFSIQKIQETKDSLAYFQGVLSDISDSLALKNLQTRYPILILLNDSMYWQKWAVITAADAVAQLTAIQNRVLLSKIPCLNYIYGNTGDKMIRGDSYKIAIAPRKAFLLEGESFNADIYIASYFSRLSDVIFNIDNQKLPIKDGIAHFEKIETTVGKKTVKVEARIRNPLTGQTTSSFGEFEYEVLPKCSRDCK